VGFAKRSMTVASAFGLAGALSAVVLGDESGYALTDNQKMKLAALEAMWQTDEPPAPLTIIGFPNQETRETEHAINIPWVLGLIATRSLRHRGGGHSAAGRHAETRIENGVSPMTRWSAARRSRRSGRIGAGLS
jgi:cytochrome d ubiquinol oxidase subunit I